MFKLVVTYTSGEVKTFEFGTYSTAVRMKSVLTRSNHVVEIVLTPS